MPQQRPWFITVICILGFITLLLSILAAFTETAKAIGSWYSPYLVLGAVIGLVAYTGIWRMKKWGVLTFVGLFAVNNIVLFVMGAWNMSALILPAVLIALLFWKYKLMS